MLTGLYITKSRIRRAILALFFTNPSCEYYLRDLERTLGFSAGSIRRELLKFKEAGLFQTVRKGNLVYYSLRKNHPLLEEIRSIVSKTIGVEAELRKVISRVPKVREAFIYGSYAAGKDRADSDIDVMVIGEPDVSLLNERIAGLESKLKRNVEVSVYSQKEWKEKEIAGSEFISDIRKRPTIDLVGEDHAS